MKKISFLLLALALVITLSACTKATPTPTNNNNQATPQTNNQTAPQGNVQPSTNTTPTPAITADARPRLITLTEVSLHNNASDCWMVINDNVYDVNPYIKLGIHPGGEKILNGCGLDATAMFNSIDKHASAQSQTNLAKYQIGTLAK
jgi:cytochrome b involved in lipid metabolism